MKVIVDTDVWSESLRRKKGGKSHYAMELTDLIHEGRVEMVGPIRMEVLCGIRKEETFEKFSKVLAAFTDRPITSEIYTLAAKLYNICRSKGIQGSNTDFLICSCSISWRTPILSKDIDFNLYKKHLPIELLEPRKR